MGVINYKHLNYFLVVAREGSIARAAVRLNLTPQTISGQLSAFEHSLGVKLLAKTGRNLSLTETGRMVLGYAEEIFLLGAELEDMLRHRPTGRPLSFSVGVADVVPKMIAYRLIEPSMNLPQPVRVVCQESHLDTLLADLAIHKLDVVIADCPLKAGTGVKAFNHLLGECGVTFVATNKLARRYQRGFPRSLDGAPMLLPTPHAAVRGALMQWFNHLQIRPQILGEFDDSALMKAFGQAGVGVFAVPWVLEKEITQQYEVAVVGRTEEVRQQFYAISVERKIRHPAVVAICESAREKMFGRAGAKANKGES